MALPSHSCVRGARDRVPLDDTISGDDTPLACRMYNVFTSSATVFGAVIFQIDHCGVRANLAIFYFQKMYNTTNEFEMQNT